MGDDVVPDALISIHAPQWGATRGRWRRSNAIRFQSTHPSGVRQPFLPRVKMHVEISIHAPQWGATGRSGQAYDGELISIHAPQWGATVGDMGLYAHQPYFNPRTPVGCDPPKWGQGRATCRISIHAPQWGATVPARRGPRPRTISIHAPQWGATRVSGRVRRTAYFNPRTPVGCDRATHGSKTSDKISIHAPQWGATA